MSYVTYTAKRELSASNGHVLNESYTLSFSATKTRTFSRQAEEHIADDGTTYTVLDRIDKKWTVVTRPVNAQEAEVYREFLHSVYGGETFIFDPFGTEAYPDSPLNCKLEGDWSEISIGYGRHYRYQFTARVIS